MHDSKYHDFVRYVRKPLAPDHRKGTRATVNTCPVKGPLTVDMWVLLVVEYHPEYNA